MWRWLKLSWKRPARRADGQATVGFVDSRRAQPGYAANEQIGIAKAAFYPSLSFGAGAGSQTTVYDATVANYRQTVLTAFQQVEDSLAQLRILSEEGAIADRAVKAAQQSLDISTEQYRGGMANYLQVITAQTSLLQNQRSVVDILTRRMAASVSLIQALGGGWDASQLPRP